MKDRKDESLYYASTWLYFHSVDESFLSSSFIVEEKLLWTYSE